MPHRLRRHRLEHAQRAGHVVAIVPDRLPHRLADVEKCREVHHSGDVVPPQHRPDGSHVGDVPFDQLAVLDGASMSGREIVVDDDAVTGAAQSLGGVAADVAGATGHQDGARATAQWRNT
jgi:hypothetical protein